MHSHAERGNDQSEVAGVIALEAKSVAAVRKVICIY